MKRLKNKLLAMETSTTTYKEMYEGYMLVYDPAYDMDPVDEYNPTYYNERIGFQITGTHKLAQDKPTVTISIPCDMLSIDTMEADMKTAAADFCLRAFGKYIEELNEELYNRSRPDNENGKYYLCRPGGEVLKRNTAYFGLCPQKDYRYLRGSEVVLLNDGVSRPPLMCLCIRLQVQLPKKKLRKTVQMLCRDLPDAVDRFIMNFDGGALEASISLARKQSDIRKSLKGSEYCRVPRELTFLCSTPCRSSPRPTTR